MRRANARAQIKRPALQIVAIEAGRMPRPDRGGGEILGRDRHRFRRRLAQLAKPDTAVPMWPLRSVFVIWRAPKGTWPFFAARARWRSIRCGKSRSNSCGGT